MRGLDSVAPSGLVVAALGFVLTRSTVTLTARGDLTEFVLVGLVPLVLGLGLTVLGVALAVGSFEPWYVRTSAAWCGLGFLSMVLLVGLSVLGTEAGMVTALRTDPVFANVLIGGSVGGTLTGMYAARTRRERRASRNRANRLVVLNRILREEVINAVTVIRARAQLVDEGDDDGTAAETITEYADRIGETIENVEYLTETADDGEASFGRVDVDAVVAAAARTVRERHPDATVRVRGETDVEVHANDRLERALVHLLENGVVHGDAASPTVTVTVETVGDRVRLAVADDGPGLPERERRLLEDGEIPEHDDPGTGFGLNVVRLLVESYRGRIETTVDDGGTTVTLFLGRATPAAARNPDLADVRSYGVPRARLVAATAAALVAGAVMGLVVQATAGAVPVIGALYGTADPLVGAVTHEFHSVVFGVIYAALLGVVPGRWRDGPLDHVLVALAWAGFLWLFAAGVVMPVWLRLVGVSVPLPNLTLASLLGHAVWGLVLGTTYYALTDGVGRVPTGGSVARLWPSGDDR